MNKQIFVLSLMAIGVVVPVSAQSTMRARMTGDRGDRGKCTIEVEVDGVADVEVSGDQGRIRTLSGQPANWRRLECSEPLPRDPNDFRFRGIDGRGRVQLIRDPRQGRGVAVVRIEDNKGGREGYTFDLEWRGGSNYGRPGNDRPWDGRGPRDRDDRNDRYMVTCASDDRRRRYCEADTSRGVRLVRQLGGAGCRQGSSWGYDRRGIWVDRGCRAEFEVGR